MDEQQIGGGSGNNMGPSSAEQADNSGPLEKRILSKNWSVRAGAYEELTKLSTDSKPKSKADFFRDHIGSWKDYLKDSNPGALEKALRCLQAFLDKIHPSLIDETSQNNILSLLVEKCLGHAKPVIKELGTECMLLLFEVSENFEISVDTLQGLCKHKNIKVMTCGTLAVAAIFQNFGVKKLKVQDFAEQMLKNAQATNPACKNAAYDYYKALYKWIGDAILPQIEDKLKKIQVDDLKKLFEEIKAKGDKTKRVVRSEKAAAEEEAKNAAIDAAMAEEAKNEPELDPLEFAPEKDILQEYGPEWQEATAAIKKWDDKVAKINELAKACENVKIKNGNTDPMVQFLKKEVAASNMNISIAAINASGSFANGLGEQFGSGAKILAPVIMLKFKEKRPIILDAIKKFVDVLPKCTNLEDLQEEIIPLITNVAPGVKSGVIKWLENTVQVTYIDVLKRVSNDYLTAVKKAIDDKDGGVRDVALHCMGIFKGRLEGGADQFLKDVNPQKMAKIEEASKEIKPSKYDRPKNWKPKPKAAEKKPKKEADDELMTFDSDKPVKPKPKGIGQKPPSRKKKEDAQMKDEESKGGDNDDQLMSFDNGPPTKPPPKIGQKPPSRKKPAAEQEEEKVPEKKPVKPKAGGGKPMPQIDDADAGGGLSKEDAIAKVEDFFDPGTVKKFEEAKWQTKQEAFGELQQQIVDKEATHDIIEAAAKFIKARMKDWKESNINLQKAIITFFNFIATECEVVNKRTVFCASSFFVDKIGDVKLSNMIKEMLMNISELVTPKFVSGQIIKHALNTKAPKNIQESCNILTQITEEFGIKGIPLKESIDFGKVAAGHATPAVRQAAMKLFCELYKHAGEAIKAFLTDIKESTLKLINAELSNVTQYKKGEFVQKRQIPGEGGSSDDPKKPGKKEEDPLDCLPREDISKKLTSKLMEQFNNKTWSVRKKGADDVEAILKEAKMRIQPNGLNELMDALKKGMKDPNKAVVKSFINLLGLMADALGPQVKQYVKKCLVPMLTNISDKQSLVRNDVIASMNKWSEAIGAEIIINQLAPVLEIENPEGRTESFKWINENKNSIASADTSALIKPLTLCLTDKSKTIRQSSEDIIKIVMPIVGYQSFVNATADMKPAIKQTLKPILEKLKQDCGGAAQEPQKAPAKEAKERSKSPMPKEAKKGSFEIAAENKKKEKEKTAPSAKPLDSARDKKKDDDDEVKIKVLNRQKRQQNDIKNKWPLYDVEGDHIAKLKTQCMDCFGAKFHDLMWAKAQDFNKHIKCIDTLEGLIQTQPDEITEILDIIFKWCNVKMNESTTKQLYVKILDFYGVLLEFLIKSANLLEEFEVHVLLGTLCDKVGINNKILMDKIRKLIKLVYEVYDIKLCYRLIVDIGCKAKNLKSVAQCLEEVSEFVNKNGDEDIITKKDYAFFVSCVDSPDSSVRDNALKVFSEAYIHSNEDIWRQIPKDTNTKVKDLLDQKFKAVDKKRGNTNPLVTSTNSQQAKGLKKSNLAMSGSAVKKRMSVMPQQEEKLKFNRLNTLNQSKGGFIQQSAEKSPKSSGEGSNKIIGQMQKFAPFDEKEEQKQDLQDVFQGKKQNPQEDIEMVQDKIEEDPQAVIVNPGLQKAVSSQVQENQPQDRENQKDVQMDESNDDINEAYAQLEQMDMDPALKQERQKILEHIQQLVEGDLLKRVDSLVALNEIISNAGGQSNDQSQLSTPQDTQNQQLALIRSCNELINAFTLVMKDIFSYQVNDIPLRFTKYFITIVNKTCACKEIMKEVNEKQVYNIAEQLLTRLLIDNLDKIGQNKEGELILKNLNSAMLRMLENCNHTFIFVVLFKLLRLNKDNADMPKLAGLIIKCLLKLSKIMDKLIENINLSKFLVAIHEYLCVINHDNKSQNDDLGIRIVKTLINEVVKLKKNNIWENYKVIEQHSQTDNHIKKWIQIILRSLPDDSSSPAPPNPDIEMDDEKKKKLIKSDVKQPSQTSKIYIEFEIKKIIQELKDPQKMEIAIPKLDKFAKQNPTYNFQVNLQKESNQFCQQIMLNLESFRNGNSWKSTNEDSLGTSGPDGMRNSNIDKMSQLKNKLNAVNQAQGRSTNPLPGTSSLNNSLNKQSEFQNKMALLKQRQQQNMGSQSMRGTIQGTPSGQSNLNSSFSAMNNTLSKKWAAINNTGGNAFNKKIGNQTGRQTMQTNTNLAQTIQPGVMQQNQLNSSSNRFQSKLGGPNRFQSGQIPPTGMQKPSQLPNQQSPQVQQPSNISQAQLNQNANNLNKSLNNKGGVSMNSFKSRLQSFQAQNQGVGNQTSVPLNRASGGPGANTQDLKNRLAEMKAKLQGMNNKK